MPEEKKINVEEQVDANCFKMFGYSPNEISEINEVLDDCDKMICFHMENTAAESESSRQKMSELAVSKDLLNIEVDDLFLTSLEHIKKAREIQYLGKDVKEGKDEEFLKRFEKIKKETRNLLHSLKDYVLHMSKH